MSEIAPHRLLGPRIAMLAAAHLFGTAGYLAVMAMGPVIRDDMGITAAQFGFFLSAFFAAQGIAAIPSGLLSDRLGIGLTLVIAMALLAFGYGLFAIAESFAAAVAAMFVAGLGYSLVNPATAMGVLTWFAVDRRVTAMGLKQLGVPLGGLIGASAGALAAWFDWRPILAIIVVGVVATSLAWLSLARRPNWTGASIRGIGLDLKSVFAHRQLRAMGCACVCFNAGQSAMFSYLALFLRDACAANQPFAGLAVAVAQGTSAVGRIGWSYLTDTFFRGRRKTVVVPLTVAGAVAFAAAALVGPGTARGVLLLLVLAMGGSIAAYVAIVLAMTAEAVPTRLTGAAIGFNGVAFSIGGTIGPPLFGLVLDHAGSYGMAWLTLGAVLLAGAGILAFGYRERPPPTAEP